MCCAGIARGSTHSQVELVGLDEDSPNVNVGPRHATQDPGLGALDIDRQQVDGAPKQPQGAQRLNQQADTRQRSRARRARPQIQVMCVHALITAPKLPSSAAAELQVAGLAALERDGGGAAEDTRFDKRAVAVCFLMRA